MGKVLQLYNGEAEKLYGRRDGVRANWLDADKVRLLQGRPGSSQTLILHLGSNKDVDRTKMLYYDYYSNISYCMYISRYPFVC